MLQVEQFHGQSERLVRQELSAHFSLIAMTRLFTNQSEAAFPTAAGKEPLQANFRNGLRTVGRHLEGLFLAYAATLSETVFQHPRRRRHLPPAEAFEPLLPAPLAQARQPMEVPQARSGPQPQPDVSKSAASTLDIPISP